MLSSKSKSLFRGPLDTRTGSTEQPCGKVPFSCALCGLNKAEWLASAR